MAPRLSTRLIQADNLQRKSCCIGPTPENISIYNVCNNNNFTVQTVKCVFNVTAILIHDTLQTTFPLSDAVTNDKRCGSARHFSTIAYFN